MASDADAVSSELYSLKGFADPFPLYTRLRRDDPIRWISSPHGEGSWLVTRYGDAQRVLIDETFSSDPDTQDRPAGGAGPGPPLTQLMTEADPPRHDLLRASVRDFFTVPRVQARRARIQAIANQLIDAVYDRGHMDLAGDYAFPLPMVVILEVLGLPLADSERLLDWSRIIIDADLPMSAELRARRSQTANEEIVNYIGAKLEDRRRERRNDLISSLLDSGLTQSEMIGMVWLLASDAFEAVGCFIGNAMAALLRTPGGLEVLRRQPWLVGRAVEELLRYESSAATVRRYARRDVEIAGQSIRKGDAVTVALISANRDERRFDNADTLHYDRSERGHLAFGKGPHACVAAALARVESHVAISTLLRRLPHLRLAPDPQRPEWRPSFMMHGRLHIPVRFD